MTGPLLPAVAAALAATWFTLTPGARLHRDPAISSPALAIVDGEATVEALDEKEGWVLVRYLGREGWVRRTAPGETIRERNEAIPEGATWSGDVEPPDILQAARARLGDGAREVVLERFRLLTDIADEDVLARLSRAALDASRRIDLYLKVRSGPRSGTTVLLFSRAEDAATLDRLACGRARIGVVVSRAVPGDADATIRRVLHQAGHLFALEVLGTSAPPWLEEGLADSFASFGELNLLAPLHRPPTGAPRGEPRVPLASALAAGRELFTDDPRGRRLRRESRTFVRYLVEGERPDRRTPFRDYLGRFFLGVPVPVEGLERILGADVETLQRASRAWEAKDRDGTWTQRRGAKSAPTPFEP